MEAQAKMLADLIATVSSMNAKLDDLHPVVLELNQCRPGVERAADALRAEVGDLRARVVDTTHPAEPAAGTDMPPPFLLSADAPSSSSKPASASKQTSAAAATSGIDVCTLASPLDTNGCVAEVPAQACSSPDQDALSTSMGVTTVELLREQPPELVPMSAALRGYSSSASIVKETLGVDPSAARCSTKCVDEKANQERHDVSSVPWLSNIGYLAGLQLKPPWPFWIGEQSKLQNILVEVSTTSFAMLFNSYHADQDTRIEMEMSSVSRELDVINLDDGASFAVQMPSSDVEKLPCLSREFKYLWQFNIDAHLSLFPWNPGGCLPRYSSRGLNFPCRYVVEDSCHDILGIIQIHDMLMAMGMELNVLDHFAQLLLSWFLGVLIERSTMGLQFSVCSDVWVSSPWDPGQAADDHEYIVEPYFTKIIYSQAIADMCRKQRTFQSLQVLSSNCPRFLQFEKMHDVMGAVLESNSWPYWQSYSLDPIMPGMHGLELSSCGFWVDILLPLLLVFAPDWIIYFQDRFDYSHNKWLFDRKSDILGLLQLVTEAPSHDTTKNNQAATMTCSLGISCFAIAGGVDPLCPGTTAVYSEILLTLAATAYSLHQLRLGTTQWKIVWPFHQGGSAKVYEFKESDMPLPKLVDWDFARLVAPRGSQFSLISYGTLGPSCKMVSDVQNFALQDKATLGSRELTEGVLYMSIMEAVEIGKGVQLFVLQYWPGNFGGLQWDPGGICDVSTEFEWGQAKPQAYWERTYGPQLVMCSHMWKVASRGTTGKRYGHVCWVHVIRLMIYPVRVCGLGLDFDKVRTTWDPGGVLVVHRLGGKPIFKKGGMSRTCYALGRGPLLRAALAWEATGRGYIILNRASKEGIEDQSGRPGCFGRGRQLRLIPSPPLSSSSVFPTSPSRTS